jgi:galactokinase
VIEAAALADQAAAWFLRGYGTEPEGVWHGPGRVNLIGEHTDYNEGFVLPFALREGVAAAAARRDDGMLALSSGQDPAVATIPLAGLAPGAVTGWAAYPAGVAWALREAGHPVAGVSIAIDSDLPAGAGLASSAALECAVAIALTGLYGLEVPRPELAVIAQHAENEFVGVPSGIMDQSAALRCQAGHALLLDCRSGDTDAVPFDTAAAGLRLLVIDTRARHQLTGGDYANRRGECEEACRLLGIPSLRYLTGAGDTLGKLADPILRRRVRHVITDNQRVREVVALLRAGGIGKIGPLLTESHASLRDDFEISWPEADTAVDAAGAAGALGARMVGGGFGGSVIALVPEARGVAVRDAVREAYAGPGWAEPRFLDAIPSESARRLR